MRSGTGWVASQSARSQPRRARVALS
jgi:hypothetical protein